MAMIMMMAPRNASTVWILGLAGEAVCVRAGAGTPAMSFLIMGDSEGIGLAKDSTAIARAAKILSPVAQGSIHFRKNAMNTVRRMPAISSFCPKHPGSAFRNWLRCLKFYVGFADHTTGDMRTALFTCGTNSF